MTEEVHFILSADDAKATAALKRTEDGIKRVGTATAYTKQQMQQLSFQMTDIVSGLATGQSPFMILMQQGGQLRDTFGGLGGAVRAVASVFTLGRVAALGMAGGVGTLAAAAYEGYQESNRLRDSILLTGNAAGITEGSFNSLTERIAATSTATIGAAREMTQALVETGRIGGPALEAAARAAALMQRATGAGTEDIVRQFSSASRGVAKFAQEMNERYHFLDVATLKLIQTQEKLGNTQEAMRIAFEALRQPFQRQQEGLDGLERAWVSVGKAASEAWDRMLSTFRAETVDQQIAKVQKLLEANARRTDFADSIGPNGPRKGADARGAELQLELAGLMRQRRGEMGAADLAALMAAQEQRAIEAARATGGRKTTTPYRTADPNIGPPTFDQQYPFPDIAGILGYQQDNRGGNQAFRRHEIGQYGETDGYLQRQAEETVERNRWMAEQLKPEWQKLAESWENTNEKMAEVGKRFTDGFVDAGRDAFDEFMRTGKLSADAFKNLFVQTLTELIYDRVIAKQMGQLGEMLWNYVANGMSGGGWSFGGSGGAGASSGGGEFVGPPQLATGTNYVPYDGFRAVLHRGEAVVPAKYNPAAGGRGAGVTIIQHINVGQGATSGEVYVAMRAAKEAAVAEIQKKIDRGNRMFGG